MICFILVEPFVNFYLGSQKFETNDGLFPPLKLSFGMIATQIFTFCPVRWTLSDTQLAWNWTRMRISVKGVYPWCFHGGVSEARSLTILCGELWKGGGPRNHFCSTSSLFTDCPPQHSGDYGCPPPELFIWCGPKKKKVGGWWKTCQIVNLALYRPAALRECLNSWMTIWRCFIH